MRQVRAKERVVRYAWATQIICIRVTMYMQKTCGKWCHVYSSTRVKVCCGEYCRGRTLRPRQRVEIERHWYTADGEIVVNDRMNQRRARVSMMTNNSTSQIIISKLLLEIDHAFFLRALPDLLRKLLTLSTLVVAWRYIKNETIASLRIYLMTVKRGESKLFRIGG